MERLLGLLAVIFVAIAASLARMAATVELATNSSFGEFVEFDGAAIVAPSCLATAGPELLLELIGVRWQATAFGWSTDAASFAIAPMAIASLVSSAAVATEEWAQS